MQQDHLSQTGIALSSEAFLVYISDVFKFVKLSIQFQVHVVIEAMRILLLNYCQWSIGKTKELRLFSWVGHNVVSKVSIFDNVVLPFPPCCLSGLPCSC